MANYCANSIYFYGSDKKLLTELWKKIDECIDNRENRSVKKLLLLHGYTQDEADELADGRDYFTYLDDSVTACGKDEYSFCAETESAWEPGMDAFEDLLVRKYRNKIKMVYQSEEPGCGIFVNSDKDGIYFTDRFRISWCYNDKYGTAYFSDWEETVEDLNGNFPKAKIDISTTPAEAEKHIRKAYGLKDGCNDFITVDVFECSEETAA